MSQFAAEISQVREVGFHRIERQTEKFFFFFFFHFKGEQNAILKWALSLQTQIFHVQLP